MNKKYFVNILKLVTEEAYNDYENQYIDKWHEGYQVGSYKSVESVVVSNVEQVKRIIAKKPNPSLYIYTIREIDEDE